MITIREANQQNWLRVVEAVREGTPVAWSLPGNTGIIWNGEEIYAYGPNVAEMFEPFASTGIFVAGSNLGIAATLPDWNGTSTQDEQLADDWALQQILTTVI